MLRIKNIQDIRNLMKLRRGNLILTEDLKENERLCEVMFVDHYKIWTKGFSDKIEYLEEMYEMTTDYKNIYLIGESFEYYPRLFISTTNN